MLGITLPMHNVQAGVYAEEETRRLVGAFDSLFYSLADKRLHFLPRESDPQKIPGAYEFPREFRKLRNAVVQFLVDVGTSQPIADQSVSSWILFHRRSAGNRTGHARFPLQRSRFLRKAKQRDMQRECSRRCVQAAAPIPAAAPAYTGTKRVPQWVFATRLFNQVILQDRAAFAASGSSTKTSGMQRLLADWRVAVVVLRCDRRSRSRFLRIARW